jgi:hypothetical protein
MRLAPGERVIVDEVGMLDQATTIALLTTTSEAGEVDDGSLWAQEATEKHGAPRTVRLPTEYVPEWSHLSDAAPQPRRPWP